MPEISGEQVKQRRLALAVSRREFADACKLKESRILAIETRDHWLKDNRQVVAETLDRLEADPPRDRLGRKRGETGEERAVRLMAMLETNGKALHLLGGDEEELPFDQGFLVLPDDQEPIREPEPLLSSDEDDELGLLVEVEEAEIGVELEPGKKYLTNSEIATWNRCRRKWWLAFYRRLVEGQVDYFGARSIGNRVHRALEAYYRNQASDPRAALEQTIADDWEAIAQQAAETGIPGFEENTLADIAGRFQDAVSLERAMIEGYMEWLAETGADAEYRVIGAEQVVTASLVGEVAGEKVEVEVLGKMDARLERKQDGAVFFMDHKSVDQFAPARQVLALDPQMLHYHFLEFLANGGEQRCEGALYNMLRKVKRTQRAKPPFFERDVVRHNIFEIESYRLRLLGAARDIMRATRELDAGNDHRSIVYPTPAKDCAWSCDFFKICGMFDDGSNVEGAIASWYHEGDPLQRYAKDQEGLGI